MGVRPPRAARCSHGRSRPSDITGALVALAVPSVASASKPATPGGFGTERASNIQTFFTNDGLGNWGQWSDGAAARAGDNGEQNQEWMADYGYLPVESSLTTP